MWKLTPPDMKAWREALGGSSFVMCMGAHCVNTILFATHVMSENGYLMTFNGTVVAFLAAASFKNHLEAKQNVPGP